MASPPQAMQAQAVCFRELLTEVFDDLLEQVVPPRGSLKLDSVKTSLNTITARFIRGLSRGSRISGDDAANRCAYFFFYFTHHCYLVYCSLQHIRSDILTSWQHKQRVTVCSIGGGPGPDLVGLTKFLQDTKIPSSLINCRVLDLFPNWKHTWDTSSKNLSINFKVTYERCDLVRDTKLPSNVISFIRDVDLLTLVKSFSAVSGSFQNDPNQRELLLSVLKELKDGCLVLFIDDEYEDDEYGDDKYEDDEHEDYDFGETFASEAALERIAYFRGEASSPLGEYSPRISNYCDRLDCKPMQSFKVAIKVFQVKKSEAYSVGMSSRHNPPGPNP